MIIAGRDVNLFGVEPFLGAVPSHYRLLVEDLVAERPRDRDSELDELRSFSAGDAPYCWYEGAPWSGKTALLAWFVLNPPDNVVPLYYFVSRRTGRNTYADCVDTLLRQLCDLTETVLSPNMSASQRDEQVRRLLQDAAAAALSKQKTLMVIIDGLDEDEALVSSTTAPMISTVLPSRPHAGLRIAVSSRPGTHVPVDHPLRSCRRVMLAPSPHATEIRDRATAELRQYLRAGGIREHIVGFLVAARSGLSSSEIGELVGEPPYRSDELLEGSRIAKSESRYSDAGSPVAFVLSHDELYVQARAALGTAKMTELTARIDAWAAGYREKDWPSDTPVYLLFGYSRTLADRGDSEALGRLAVDRRRHDLMEDVSGGHSSALAEVGDALDLIAKSEQPDLRMALRLAWRRYELNRRTSDVPPSLPTLWATVGHPWRAEAVAPARSMMHAFELAQDLARAGLIRRAFAHARSVPALYRSDSIAKTACAIAETGDYESAVEMVASTVGLENAIHGLLEVSRVAETADDKTDAVNIAQHAATLAESVTDPDTQADLVAKLAEVIARTTDYPLAVALASSLPLSRHQAQAMTRAAQSAVDVGDPQAGVDIVRRAEAIAMAITDDEQRAHAICALVEVAARARDYTVALDLAAAIPADHAAIRVRAVVDVGQNARHDDPDGALRILRLAAELAREVTPANSRAASCIGVARAIAGAGKYSEAVELAMSIAEPYLLSRVRALVAIADAAVLDHDETVALQTTADALASAESITVPAKREEALRDIAVITARAGDCDTASRIAESLTDTSYRDRALTAVAKARADVGDYAAASEAISGIADSRTRSDASSRIAALMAHRGEADVALDMAMSITNPHDRGRALIAIAKDFADAGDTATALRVTAAATGTPTEVDYVRAAVAKVIAQAGDYQNAVLMAAGVKRTYTRADALANIGLILAQAGDRDRAISTAHLAEKAARSAPVRISVSLPAAVGTQSAVGNAVSDSDEENTERPHRRASRLAQSGSAYIRTGHYGSATEILQRAAEAALQIDPADALRDATLVRITRLMVEARDIAASVRVAESISNARNRIRTLAAVARAAAQAGDDAEATRTAHRIETEARAIDGASERAEALLETVKIHIDVGAIDTAIDLASAFDTAQKRAEALSAVGHAVADRGDHAGAIDTARQAESAARAVSPSGNRAHSLAIVAPVYAAAGDIATAIAIADSMSEPYFRALAYNRIVETVARIQGSEAAVEIAMRLRDPYEQSDALKTIAQVAASGGDDTTAIRLARRAQAAAQAISNVDHRLGVLAKLVPLLFDDLQATELDELLKGAEEEVLLDVARRQASADQTHHARVAMVRAWAVAIGEPALTLLPITDPQILDDIRTGVLVP